MAWTNILFYGTFLSQIFLISFYIPNKLLTRMQHVLKTYPAEQYPKLYPQPTEYYKIGHRLYRWVNRGILALGFLIMFAMINWVDHSSFADDGFISEAWPAAYGAIQFLPLIFLEFSEFGQFKLMRLVNSSATRTAELRPRRLLDFVSPAVIATAALLYSGTILIDFYVHDFVFQWNQDSVQRALWLTLGNLVMMATSARNLYGLKMDPHQAFEDRARMIRIQLASVFYVSMAMSVFFMTEAIDDVYDLDFLGAALMSLYFQAITLLSIGHILRSSKLEDIDFDVYKNGSVTT